jgi:hypothetical protein
VVSAAFAPNDVPAARAAIATAKSCFFIVILLGSLSGFAAYFLASTM